MEVTCRLPAPDLQPQSSTCFGGPPGYIETISGRPFTSTLYDTYARLLPVDEPPVTVCCPAGWCQQCHLSMWLPAAIQI